MKKDQCLHDYDMDIFKELGTSNKFPMTDSGDYDICKPDSKFMMDTYFDNMQELIRYVWRAHNSLPKIPEVEMHKRHLLDLYVAMTELMLEMKSYLDSVLKDDQEKD